MLWIKTFHIVFVVSWFAGLLYLPRLFVYHAEARDQNDLTSMARFMVMERKLLGLMRIAEIGTFILGLWLAIAYWRPMPIWLHIKLFLVVLLAACHEYYAAQARSFVKNTQIKISKFFRVINEIPAVLLVIICIFVVVKPSFAIEPKPLTPCEILDSESKKNYEQQDELSLVFLQDAYERAMDCPIDTQKKIGGYIGEMLWKQVAGSIKPVTESALKEILFYADRWEIYAALGDLYGQEKPMDAALVRKNYQAALTALRDPKRTPISPNAIVSETLAQKLAALPE